MITENDIVYIELDKEEFHEAAEVALIIATSISDRPDLHPRDLLERFIDCLMGEVAERMVLRWLHQNGKYAKPAADKKAAEPDPGHDILVKLRTEEIVCASIKSSLSALKDDPGQILSTFTLAVTPEEIRKINIQVYFWLSLKRSPRVTVPSMKQAAIVAWAFDDDLRKTNFKGYRGEERLAPELKLKDLRPPSELLDWLV
jgi:hypothetical protein